MGKWKHRLAEKDVLTRTALCSNCGVVKIRLVSRGVGKTRSWKCARGIRERQGTPGRGTRIGICPICKSEKELVWDHDHRTGQGRGWICTTCNAGLGLLGDTEDRLKSALDYLTKKASPEAGLLV